MLTREQNELLTRVGPGTPMGRFMREYWIPAVLSEELPGPDSPPLRVKLLCEDLVAFRDTDGKVGLVAQNCPHRGASLFFGRNEESGLRCVYHGWKFDTTGACVDMPNEPPESNFKHKVKVTAYPCEERNGVVWTYMGPRRTPPPLPHLEWNMVSDNVPWMWRNFRACNWLQALEGGIDSSHVNFLHRTFADTDTSTVPGTDAPRAAGTEIKRYAMNDAAPRLEIVDTSYGAIYTGARRVDDQTEYHRIHPFLYPNHNAIGGGVDEHDANYIGMVWVPMDDETTLVLEYQWRASGPYSREEQARLMQVRNAWGFMPATGEAGSAWKFRANASNDYLIDYELQKTKLFCGIQGNPLQDGAVQEGMGPIYDRTRERLGTADAMIIRVRRLLLEAVTAYTEHGVTPPGVDNPEWYAIRPVGALLPPGSNWVEATAARRTAFYQPAAQQTAH
ncbi:MAG: Rieske 2Fe-2S domain-containing protein [Chloroflexota bacterium]